MFATKVMGAAIYDNAYVMCGSHSCVGCFHGGHIRDVCFSKHDLLEIMKPMETRVGDTSRRDAAEQTGKGRSWSGRLSQS